MMYFLMKTKSMYYELVLLNVNFVELPTWCTSNCKTTLCTMNFCFLPSSRPMILNLCIWFFYDNIWTFKHGLLNCSTFVLHMKFSTWSNWTTLSHSRWLKDAMQQKDQSCKHWQCDWKVRQGEEGHKEGHRCGNFHTGRQGQTYTVSHGGWYPR